MYISVYLCVYMFICVYICVYMCICWVYVVYMLKTTCYQTNEIQGEDSTPPHLIPLVLGW